jgi:hypothetical protein
MKRLTLLSLLILALVSCENKYLYPPYSEEREVLVEVVIHWDDQPQENRPANMRVLWFPENGYGGTLDKLFDLYGGFDRLPASIYIPVCFDYYGNNRIDFRGYDSPGNFEVYNVPAVNELYNRYAEPVPGESTVAEASSPYLFYVDGRSDAVETANVPAGDTLRVHFYPANVLREYTFLVYGVEGVKNITTVKGAISGMSASYFPATDELASQASTLLFSRVETIRNGQLHPYWNEEQKKLFSDKNPDWQSADPAKGWTGDWVTGKFSTFGPVNLQSLRFRLTVEALSKNNYYYYGAWGYWHGKWDDTVGKQIKGVMDGNGEGSAADRQAWWRRQNGGFDVVLFNDSRLKVPDDDENGQSTGGFTIDTNDWITIPVTVE